MSEISTRQVGPSAAKLAIKRAFKAKRPVFVWGAPGCGKSDIIKQIGDDLEAHVIDIRLSLWDPTDIKGIPFFNSVTNTMEWAPPSELPNESVAAQHKYIILFLDEMNSASPAVQAAAYQLVLNRRVGVYTLPDNVFIVAAGNRDTDKGVTYRMPAPLANRFVHLEMRVDWDDYFTWASSNKIHKDVLGYLTYSKKDLYDFDPKSNSRAFATPRSWSFVSELLFDDNEQDSTLTDLISGAVGEGIAIKFMAHRSMSSKMPNPTDILAGKVKTLESKEISAMYSLAINLCYELKSENDRKARNWVDQANNFFLFIMQNFEIEMVVMAVKVAMRYDLPIDPEEIACFEDFHKKYGKFISQGSAQ